MRCLIDTNIFLFFILNKDLLKPHILDILEDYGNDIYISSESIKEIVILLELGKIHAKQWRNAENLLATITEWNFRIKFVALEHLYGFARLQPVANHRDPTDRMIIAQAITEQLTLISSDRMFGHYRRQHLDFLYNER